MCLRDGEQSVEDDEIKKYNLFTTDITERKNKTPLCQTTVMTLKGEKKKNQNLKHGVQSSG